uniref:RAB7B, member RAS onco family n=1 Tax=Gopherus evgoodei TaxID=1825980 RepID=A0A8C4VS80_9SAUR
MNSNRNVDLKIIIIGALGVGKTSLLHQFVHKTFHEDYRTTLGASILSKRIMVDNTPLKLQIWDTGGQERFRSMVSTFYKGSDGCMLVSKETASFWCKEKDIPYFEVSAKNDINVVQAFETLARQALLRTWVLFLALLLVCQVTFSKSCPCPVPQFLHL